jgi:hypothetical protein
MNAALLAPLLLRARLLIQRSAALCAVLALCLTGLLAWAWLLPQQAALARLAELKPVPPAAVVAPGPALPVADSGHNLARFYSALGQQGDSEQQLRTLFALAAESGLVLKQGDYKSGYDRASRIATYEMVLPLKGSYQQVWRFSALALYAMPYAALDELTFRRETIGEATPEARLRLTLFVAPVAP